MERDLTSYFPTVKNLHSACANDSQFIGFRLKTTCCHLKVERLQPENPHSKADELFGQQKTIIKDVGSQTAEHLNACGVGGPESLLTCRSKADWTLSPCPLGKSKVSTYTMTSVKATVSKYDVCFIPPPFFVEQHAHCREMKQTSITKSASSCSVLWSKRLIIICIFIISVQGGPLEAHFPSFLSSLLDRTSV